MTYVRDDLGPLHRRLALALAAFGALFLILVARLWLVQVVEGPRWRKAAENNRLRRIPLEAPRGQVLDVNGQVILTNRPGFGLLLFPEEMKDPEQTAAFLARIGIADRGEIDARIAKARSTSYLPAVIADDLAWSQVAAVAAHRAEHPELEVHEASRRAFPAGSAIAHLAGQLGEVTPEQLSADPSLRSGQLIGRSGLERAYEKDLGGKPGDLVIVVDALGRQVSKLQEEPPEPGRSLHVTVDLDLQKEAAAAMSGLCGAVVALDPRDGAVRVLLSEPAFDPDLFAGHLEPARWRELLGDPLHPLTDRAIQALYPPGSTIKPLFAAGALRDGLRTTSDTVYCAGGATIYGHRYRCWKPGGHGRVDLAEAIEGSCDTYFYRLAHDAGIDRLAAWARTFGLGSPTGIEIAGESSGLVPDDAWSQRTRGHPWYSGESISVGIGQGPILATPLQLAVAYAALVNGGRLVRPHLTTEGDAPARPLNIPPAVLAAVRQGMELVVNGPSGTARAQGRGPVRFGGKTGTSQVMRKKEGVRWQDLPWDQRHHALFVGYAPADDPRLVVAVVVEHGGDAASVAAPIARRLFDRAFGPHVGDATVVAGGGSGTAPAPAPSAAAAGRPLPTAPPSPQPSGGRR